MSNLRRLVKNQQAFTIIELMIATTVVSLILILVSVLMINIGGLYYKGISQSRTQESVRSITDEISHQLELSSHIPGPLPAVPLADGTTWLCIGTTRYTYILNKQIGTVPHVLWRDTLASSTTCPALSLTDPNPDHHLSAPTPHLPGEAPGTTGTELMGARSRLTKFFISPASPYTISIDIAFGDNDLLCNANVVGDCNLNPSSTHLLDANAEIRCKGSAAVGSSQQYCATAALTTTIVRRLP